MVPGCISNAILFLFAAGSKVGTGTMSRLPPSVLQDHADGTRGLLPPRVCPHRLGHGRPDSAHGDQLPRGGVCSRAPHSVLQCQQGLQSDHSLLVANPRAVIVRLCPVQRNCHHMNSSYLYFLLLLSIGFGSCCVHYTTVRMVFSDATLINTEFSCILLKCFLFYQDVKIKLSFR